MPFSISNRYRPEEKDMHLSIKNDIFQAMTFRLIQIFILGISVAEISPKKYVEIN